ncbi:hypothetical protein K505DRAFT_341804 [Melanomma pulvis-pyrius CBS 109.77]|uniref:Uncharacterized protein n=1 Tax=Melanomma pulvis-pyrius CBS 109.77 TaxID=1314802 RepID=A0A6A6WXV6_9PLEO|nr:hypothetical protein K505DRAFT_341804 [Melanomma pulvis-pyrius CBS 109.77]
MKTVISNITGVVPGAFILTDQETPLTQTLTPTPTPLNPSAYPSIPFPWNLVYILVPLSLVYTSTILRTLRNHTRRMLHAESSAALAATQRQNLWRAWETNNWRVLFGLSELWATGQLPWGPWDASSLQAWPDDFSLKRLCRAGIVPLYIQDGAFGTRLFPGRERWTWDGEGLRARLHIQSKRRAYFDFVMPWRPQSGRNYPRAEFLKALEYGAEGAGYAVTVWVSERNGGGLGSLQLPPVPVPWPVEYGATSKFKLLLPLKRDRVIREATLGVDMHLDNYMRDRNCPLLAHSQVVVVRIEAMFLTEVRLDQFVARIAFATGLCDKFSETSIKALTREWLAENDLGHLPGIQQYLWAPNEREPAEPVQDLQQIENDEFSDDFEIVENVRSNRKFGDPTNSRGFDSLGELW